MISGRRSSRTKPLLWITRVLLIVAVVFHIHSAYALTIMNSKARPIGYADRDYVKGTYAARTMRWGGVIILLFVFYHLAHLTFGKNVAPPAQFIHGDVYHNVVSGFQIWWVSAIYIIANLALGLHLYHGLWAMFSSLGMTNPRFKPGDATSPPLFAVVITAANISFPLSVLTGFVTYDHANSSSKIPPGPLAEKWEYAKSHYKLVNPANKRKYDIIVVGAGLAGASAAASLGGARLQREVLRLPRLAAARALHRRAGRHQRREELPQRRRQRLPPLLRHDQRRRLSRRVKATSIASPSCRVNIIDQAVAQGVPFAREYGGMLENRSFGGVQVSRTFYARGPDRPAAPPRRIPGAGAPDRGRHREAVQPPRDARSRRRRRPREGHHHAQPRHRKDRVVRRRRGRPRHRRLCQRLLPLDECDGFERDRHLARVSPRRRVRESLLHADPSDLHPADAATINRSSR